MNILAIKYFSRVKIPEKVSPYSHAYHFVKSRNLSKVYDSEDHGKIIGGSPRVTGQNPLAEIAYSVPSLISYAINASPRLW